MNSALYKIIRIAIFLIIPVLTFSVCWNKELTAQRIDNEHAVHSPMEDSLMRRSYIDSVPVSFLLGKFNPATHPEFRKLGTPMAGGSALGAYLQKDCFQAFSEMRKAALAEGIELTILSATRNFDRQRSIWESKWKGNRLVEGKNLKTEVPDPEERALMILRWSSMPGTSRHHWGTDIDLNAFNNGYFESGRGLAEYEWLQANASRYGFCQPYTPKGEARPDGYQEEKWHWSYVPIAQLNLIAYARRVKDEDITGFAGAEVATKIKVIERYVFGVNQDCF